MADASRRRFALADQPPLVIPAKVSLEPCGPATRFIFRGGVTAAAAMKLNGDVPGGASRGYVPDLASRGYVPDLELPQEPCRTAEAGDRAALWLGPDEWLLLAGDGEAAAITARAATALGDTPHSLVDISHRQVGMNVGGPNAVDLLAAGCPLDLDPRAFPIGMCTRTLLAKAELVLWRRGPDLFRLELRRSFAAYAWAFLTEAAREYRAD